MSLHRAFLSCDSLEHRWNYGDMLDLQEDGGNMSAPITNQGNPTACQSLIDVATQKIVEQGFTLSTARAIAGIAASVFKGELHTVPQGGEEKRNECDCLRRPDSEGIPTGEIPVSPAKIASCEITVIERGTIQHLVKREIPMLLLGLSQREPDEGEVTTTDEFLSEIENALESCRNQLEAVMLTKPIICKDMELTDEQIAEFSKPGNCIVVPITEPVLRLDEILKAYDKGYCGHKMTEKHENAIKAVIDAAGVKYV